MSFLAVPPEVQQLIIDELRRSEDLKARAELDESFIIYHDLINWSCLHSYFRNLLAPHIFKTVKLVNDEKSGASLDAVVRSPHCVHVETLHFIGSASDKVKKRPWAFHLEKYNVEKSDSEQSDGEHSDGEQSASSVHDGIFPRSVDGLLSNSQRFLNLKSLSIRVDHYGLDTDDWGNIRNEENAVFEAEADSPWRALMSLGYAALSRNKTPHVKHLDIRQLARKEVSTFRRAAFHVFLGHLEQFTLSIHGEILGMAGSNLDGYYSNAQCEYSEIIGTLDQCFFDHLAHVTILSIKAPEEGPLGQLGPAETRYSPLALRAGHMPLLKILNLEYAFASRELIGFLVYHQDTLEEVTLRNCYASVEDPCRGTLWSKLFKSLWSARPTKLRRFELVRDKPDPPFESEGFSLDEEETVQTLLQDPGNMIFPYANIDQKSGRLVFDGKSTWRAFLEQKDQKYWCRLKKWVDRNAMKVIEE
ncbi:hypothetical protein MMC07_004238 [Pseudocyphellaria aurata]|nr:hypothetical protein [Pseudocyphellaria aurata]